MLAPSVRRWTVAERNLRIGVAPEFAFPPPLKGELDLLVLRYVEVTSDPVATPKKRNLVASCYRVHGDDFVLLVQGLFQARGSATNLLGEIRCLPRRLGPGAVSTTGQLQQPNFEASISRGHAGMLDCGCDVATLVPGLIYCESHRPPFTSRDTRRHDRRPSNPEAARFITDGELGGPMSVGQGQ